MIFFLTFLVVFSLVSDEQASLSQTHEETQTEFTTPEQTESSVLASLTESKTPEATLSSIVTASQPPFEFLPESSLESSSPNNEDNSECQSSKESYDEREELKYSSVHHSLKNNTDEKKELSGGEIAGIACSCVAVVSGITIGFFYFLKKRKSLYKAVDSEWES